MKRFFAMLGTGAATCLMLGAVAAAAQATPAPSGPGNSAAAHACENGGWQNLVTATGATFASQDECVAYAAHGGTLAQKPTAVITIEGAYPGPSGICEVYWSVSGLAPSTTYTYVVSSYPRPNPFTTNPDGSAAFQGDGMSMGPTTIQIYDGNGQLLATKSFTITC